MSDKVEVAGAVGTWVAVAVALVALIGIVTPWILLRESRSERFQAINAVDVQKTKYIRGGFNFRNGRRYFQRVKVPMLMDPPKPGSVVELQESSSMDGPGSGTGWVNLAVILEAYAPGTPKGDQLRIFQGETLLPVHRFWLLTLGLLGRYGKRKDGGIAISQSNARRLMIESHGFLSDRMFYGLTGRFYCVSYEPEIGALAPFVMDKVYFRLHSVENRESLYPDPMSRPLLFWLALGCLPLNLNFPDMHWHRVLDLAPFQSSLRSRYTNTENEDGIQLFRYKQRKGLKSGLDNWADSMGVSMSQLWCVEKVETPENSNYLLSSAQEEKGDWFKVPKSRDHLIWKTDIYCLAAGVLMIPVSPKGFLFDVNRGLHKGLFEPTAACIGKLITCAESNGFISIEEAKAASTLSRVQRGRFGRRRMQAHYALATILEKRRWEISELLRHTIGILTICSVHFRSLLMNQVMSMQSKDKEPTSETTSFSLQLNFIEKSITVKIERSNDVIEDTEDHSIREVRDSGNGNAVVRNGHESAGSRPVPVETREFEVDTNKNVPSKEHTVPYDEFVIVQEKGHSNPESSDLPKKQEPESKPPRSRSRIILEKWAKKHHTEQSCSPSRSHDQLEQEMTHKADFATIFPNISLPTKAEKLLFNDHKSDIILAALSASNKCVYFCSPLDSRPFISLIQRMGDVAYVSARPEPPHTDPWRRDDEGSDDSEEGSLSDVDSDDSQSDSESDDS